MYFTLISFELININIFLGSSMPCFKEGLHVLKSLHWRLTLPFPTMAIQGHRVLVLIKFDASDLCQTGVTK